ncbi:MAG: phosphopantetheine-binding protein [Paracoccaceae bacterium]|nr:phosphopantetheine-binding protein [Paracoccaceae bacterium]
MSDDIEKKIITILAQQALIDENEISLNSTPDDLGLDSLSLVEIIFSIEEMFDITIPFNANEPTKSEFIIENVSTIIKGVRDLIAEKPK